MQINPTDFNTKITLEAWRRTSFLDTLSNVAYKAIKKNGEFVLPGFGKLVKQKRKGRMGFNPKTQQKIKIPPRPTSNSESPRRQRTRFWG